jgi:hypothetical protein
MAKKPNLFDAPTFTFFDTVADIEFLTWATDIELRTAGSRRQEILDEHRNELAKEGKPTTGVIGISSRLLIPNLFRPKHERVSFGNEKWQDEHLITMIEELNHRAQAQCLCMVYEAFEKFLKAFAPILFYQLRATLKLAQKDQFHQKHKSMAKAAVRNTPQYFEAYTAHACSYNCDELIKEIAELLPEFDSKAKNNWLGDLYAFYRAISCLRHTTVHSNGQVSARSTKKLQKDDGEWIKQITRRSVITGEDTLLPSVRASEHFLNGIMAFVYTLYRLTSKRFNMQLNDFSSQAGNST